MKKLIAMLVVTGSLVCFSTKTSSANPLGGIAKRFKPASNIAEKVGETFSKGGKMLGRTFSPPPDSPSYLSEYSESVDGDGYVWVSSNTGNNRRTSKRARLGYYSNGKAYWYYSGKRWTAHSRYNRQTSSGGLGNSASGVPLRNRRPTRQQPRFQSTTGRPVSAARKRQLQRIIDQTKRREAVERLKKKIQRNQIGRGYTKNIRWRGGSLRRNTTRSRYSTNRRYSNSRPGSTYRRRSTNRR